MCHVWFGAFRCQFPNLGPKRHGKEGRRREVEGGRLGVEGTYCCVGMAHSDSDQQRWVTEARRSRSSPQGRGERCRLLLAALATSMFGTCCGEDTAGSAAGLGGQVGGVAAGAMQRRLLSHWDGKDFPPPTPKGVNTRYNPLDSTQDAARTWNPVYPNKYYIEQVTADFSPACPPLELEAPGRYEFIDDCLLSERHDVWSDLSIVYAILSGPLTDGYRAIADAPSADSPRPIIVGVTDGSGAKLDHSLYRQGKHWFLHYTFAKGGGASKKRGYCTVHIAYQLQRVITGTIGGDNTFRAQWLQTWNSPVKKMSVLFSFPRGYGVTRYDVKPATSLEGDDEPSTANSVCCGERGEGAMERCTNDVGLSVMWASGTGACANSTVQLQTTMAVAKTEGGAPDDGIPLADVYRISFSPGIVDDVSGDAVNHTSYAWVFAILGILLFPAFAAVVYFTYTVGRTSVDDDDMQYKAS